ncbi:MAG: C-type lectin domain-containing protein [Proteobacteria bacterium]|nr:C-type lectin domain-containing protein [Pseudomonadota bacterium]
MNSARGRAQTRHKLADAFALTLALALVGCSLDRAPLGQDASGVGAGGSAPGPGPAPADGGSLPPTGPDAGQGHAGGGGAAGGGAAGDSGAAPPEPAPCGRHMHGGSVYLFCHDVMQWLDARGWCQAQGYDLVIIDDRGEDRWLWNTAARESGLPGVDWWIGLHDPLGVYAFEWVDGTLAWDQGTPLGYVNWAPGRPAGVGSCVEQDPFRGDWKEVGCAQRQAFICELPAVP